MRHLKTFFILLTIIFTAACNNGDEHEHAADDHENHMHNDENMDHSEHMEHMDGHEHHDEMPRGAATDMSIYNLTSEWTTQEGKEIGLKDLQGKVQVVAMVYTTCEYACPRIVADLKRIQSAVKQNGWQDKVNYTLVSIDPKVDTPQRLQEFAQENNMSANNWTLLNGSEGDILELAALLGVKYKKTTEKDYAHSNIITVLNQQGEIAHQQVGLNQNPDPTVEAIEDLVQKRS